VAYVIFDFLEIPKRNAKPRSQGITMILDQGLGYHSAKELMMAKEWIDIIKLGWGTPLVYPERFLKKKIKIYINNDIEVTNGGTFLELAYNQRKVDDFLKKMKEIGLTSIEVSNGIMDINHKNKAKLIKKAKDYGFKVYSEVGKKDPELDRKLSLEERIIEAKNDLKAGAFRVIMESRASGKLGIYNESYKVKEAFARKLVKELGLENLIFEAPQKSQQVWLILNFGKEVNLGNIKTDDVIPLETLRRGVRGDTFGKIS